MYILDNLKALIEWIFGAIVCQKLGHRTSIHSLARPPHSPPCDAQDALVRLVLPMEDDPGIPGVLSWLRPLVSPHTRPSG